MTNYRKWDKAIYDRSSLGCNRRVGSMPSTIWVESCDYDVGDTTSIVEESIDVPKQQTPVCAR